MTIARHLLFLSAILPQALFCLQNPANSIPAAQQQAVKGQEESVAKQRLSVTRQLGEIEPNQRFVHSGLPIAEPAQPAASCLPLSVADLEPVIQDAPQKQSISPLLIKAVIRQESAFNPCAVSLSGAQGLMQLMPATAKALSVYDALDPEQNIQGGAAYLKQMLDRYKGDLRSALVAYNAGPTRADQPRSELLPYPLETQSYVACILAELDSADSDDAENAFSSVSEANARVIVQLQPKAQKALMPSPPQLWLKPPDHLFKAPN